MESSDSSVGACSPLPGAEGPASPVEMPQPAPEISPADQAPPEPEAGTEIIAPVRVSLRSEQASGPEHRQLVMASLTTHALWIHDNRQLRRIPLRTLSNIEMRRDGRELGLTIGSEASAERPTGPAMADASPPTVNLSCISLSMPR